MSILSQIFPDDVEEDQNELVNSELEYALLGWALQDNALIDHLGFLQPEHFALEDHRAVYAAMVQCRGSGQMVTPILLSQKLPAMEIQTYLRNAVKFSAQMIRPIEEARVIVDLAERRALIAACQKHIASIRSRKKTPSEHVVDITADVSKAATVGGTTKFLTDKQVSLNILAKLNNPHKPFSTGLRRLDAAMEGGLYPSMCYLLAGRKKMGKTTLAGTISSNLNKIEVPHLYIAGEMGIEQIQQRNLSRLTQTYSHNFRNEKGRDPEFQQQISEQIDLSPGCTIYLNAPGISFDDLRRSVAQAISIYKIKGFILDSLQLVGGKDGRKSQSEHQDEVSQWIADFSRQQEQFSIVTAQINQTGNIRGGEGVRLACDMGFEIQAPEQDPSRSDRWLEMIETRYTGWQNVGSDTSPALLMNEKGPYFHDFEDQQTMVF
jgi:replicative DNA helicase